MSTDKPRQRLDLRAVMQRKDLPASAKLAAWAIDDRMGKNGASWPSHSTIAQDTGQSKAAVYYGVKMLRVAGIVEVEMKSGTSTTYKPGEQNLESRIQNLDSNGGVYQNLIRTVSDSNTEHSRNVPIERSPLNPPKGASEEKPPSEYARTAKPNPEWLEKVRDTVTWKACPAVSREWLATGKTADVFKATREALYLAGYLMCHKEPDKRKRDEIASKVESSLRKWFYTPTNGQYQLDALMRVLDLAQGCVGLEDPAYELRCRFLEQNGEWIWEQIHKQPLSTIRWKEEKREQKK